MASPWKLLARLILPGRAQKRESGSTDEVAPDPLVLLQRETVDISSVLPLCDLVVTYGTGTVHDALLAGHPLLLCPQNAEQYLVSLHVVRLGAGFMLPVNASPAAILQTVSILLSERSFSDAARAFSQKYATYSMEATVQKTVDKVVSRL